MPKISHPLKLFFNGGKDGVDIIQSAYLNKSTRLY
jgi:hypothetical protein